MLSFLVALIIKGLMMTRKDFEFIASEFKWQRADRDFCLSFGVALMKTHERFDLTKFMTACGHPPAVEKVL